MADVIWTTAAAGLVLLVCTIFYFIRRTSQINNTLAALVIFVLAAYMAGCGSSAAPTVGNKILQQKSKEHPANVIEQQAPSSQSIATPAESQLVKQPTTITGTLKVHFLDVGQADSILVQLPSGQNLLIDGGNNNDGDLVINYLKQQGVKKLDHIIGTHPHEDHIGGLDVVIRNFEVGKVYLPRASSTTKTYEDLLLAIRDKGLKATEARAGVKLDVGNDVEAVFFAPNGTGYKDLNDFSAVLKLTYGNTSSLFTGDAEAVSEGEMLAAGVALKADLLKVEHHGSNSSTTASFLKAVSPKYAVISVGKGNDYGHPHSETLSRLAKTGVQVFRTDLHGTIIATSDGRTINIDKKASPVKERAPDTATSTPLIPETAAGTTAGVKITSIDLRAEVVSIMNSSNSTVDLTGWRLISEKGNQEFTFTAGTKILPGGTLKVLSGLEAKAGPGALVWTAQNIWNNDGDPGALYDMQGNLVSRK